MDQDAQSAFKNTEPTPDPCIPVKRKNARDLRTLQNPNNTNDVSRRQMSKAMWNSEVERCAKRIRCMFLDDEAMSLENSSLFDMDAGYEADCEN